MEIKRVVLKRVVNWSGDGLTWEADPKLTEKFLNMLNLRAGNGALTPGVKDIGKDDRDVECELEYSDAKLVQAAAGLEEYIALDRPDIAYSLKTELKQMSKHTTLMQLRVVRVGRYLKNNPRLVWKFPYQQQPKSIDVFVDADFAARETMLMSTSGVAEYYWRSPIKFGSSTQSVRGLRNHEGLSAQIAQPGHFERIRGDGGSCCLVGRECWHWDLTAPRLWTTEASCSDVALGAGESLGESIATSQASHRNQHC